LPQSGKSTLFGILTDKQQDFSKEFDIAEVEVPDERVDFIVKLINPKKIIPAKITFIDIKVEAKEMEEGINAKNIRDVDELCFVLRVFKNSSIAHPFASIDPLRDLELLNTGILLSDMELVQKRSEKIEKELKKGIKENESEYLLLKKILGNLEEGLPIRKLDLNFQEEKIINGYKFLSQKPVVVVLNVDEDNLKQDTVSDNLAEAACLQGYKIIQICAELEKELNCLDEGEKKEFMKEWSIEKSAKDKFIRASYENLNLISFFTVKKEDTRVWSIKNGATAWEAAGKIHSDIQRGFIRGEIISFEDFRTCGSYEAAKEKGFLKTESKNYKIQDGDIVNFKFNV
jgi:hypothetical protein